MNKLLVFLIDRFCLIAYATLTEPALNKGAELAKPSFIWVGSRLLQKQK